MSLAVLIAILGFHQRKTRATGERSYTNLANPMSRSYHTYGRGLARTGEGHAAT
jgi:hypothetical protein